MASRTAARIDPIWTSRVSELLSARLPDVRWELLPEEATLDENWWYLPLRFPDLAPRDYMSYEAMGDIEREVEAEFGIRILLVPAI